MLPLMHRYFWLTHTHPFNGPLSRTTRVSRYQKGKTNVDFTGARDSEWQWNPLGHMQVCTSLQTDDHASIPPLSFLQAGCPSCCPTNSVKALKAKYFRRTNCLIFLARIWREQISHRTLHGIAALLLVGNYGMLILTAYDSTTVPTSS